jgi:DNA-binding transcriptional MerR regulator
MRRPVIRGSVPDARQARMDKVEGPFSAEHVERITGLTPRQIAYWDRSGFFSPSLAIPIAGNRKVRAYSFKDIVGLRVLSVLTNQHHISLQKLRRFAKKLHERSATPWASLKLTVAKGEVAFYEDSGRKAQGVISGQYVLVPLIDEIRYVEDAAKKLGTRTQSEIGTFSRKKNVSHNAEVFAGTRIPFRAIQRFIAAGFTDAQILAEYPSLSVADIQSARSRVGGSIAA